MSIELLRPSTHLSPSQTLAIAQYASTLLPSLQPSRFSLPWPLSFILPSQRESPEKWQIYENTLIALLTSSADDTALKFLSALDSRFSQDNERIQALHGIYEEAVAKDDKALKMILSKYDKLLELNPINMHIRKRRIALLLSMGRIEDGTKALVELLDVSPTDPEAWAELAEIYARNENWEKAVYCWEETILIIPNAWNVHARLGELEWLWAKSVDSHAERVRLVSTAMKSYCRSIELCDDYLRGYYGLKLTATRLLELMASPGHDQKGASALGDAALPPITAIESLNELATRKLAEIVRRGTAREAGWDGCDEAELGAARELLQQHTQKVDR